MLPPVWHAVCISTIIQRLHYLTDLIWELGHGVTVPDPGNHTEFGALEATSHPISDGATVPRCHGATVPRCVERKEREAWEAKEYRLLRDGGLGDIVYEELLRRTTFALIIIN